MLRIAVIAPETTTSAIVAAAGRLPQVECVATAADSCLDDFDAVTFAGAIDAGVQRLCAASREGKHLLVDLAALKSVADVDALVNACREGGVRLMIGQPLRFLPSVQTVKQALDAGKLGEAGLLRIHNWAPARAGRRRPSTLRELDLANWLFGRLPDDVFALSRASAKYVQVHLGFSGGGMALIDVAAGLPEGDDYYSLSVIGGDGSAYADDHHNAHLVFAGGAPRAERTGESLLHYAGQVREFAAAVDEGREPAVGAECARRALLVKAAVEQSIDGGTALHREGESYGPV